MFKNLTLAKKLGFGFGGVLIIMLVLAIVSFNAISNASEDFKEYRGLARDSVLMGRVQANMLMIRMNVKDFIITGSNKDLDQYQQYTEQTNGFMKSAKDHIENKIRSKLVNKADDDLKIYQNEFKKIIKARDERNHIVLNILNIKGPLMEKSLSEILLTAKGDADMNAAYYASLSMKHLLLARIYMAKFLDTNAQKDVDRVRLEFGEFDKNMVILDRNLQNVRRRRLFQTVKESKKLYLDNFNRLVKIIYDRNSIIRNQLDRLGPIIAKDIEDVKLSVKKDQDILGPKVQKQNDQAIGIIIVFSIISVILGIGITFFLTRSVMIQLGKDPQVISNIATLLGQGKLNQIQFDQEGAEGVYLDLKNTIENLSEIIIGVKASAESVASASVQISSSTEELAATVEEQSSQATTVASSVQELAATSNDIAKSVDNTLNSSEESSKITKEGSKIIQESIESLQSIQIQTDNLNNIIGNLGDSTDKIGNIIDVINDVADQTNLLALNAAIEAARAGEAGRGFAVVADEVRKLAERTGKATKEIEEIISALQKESESATKAMKSASKEVDNGTKLGHQSLDKLKDIVGSSDKIFESTTSVATAITEENATIEEVRNNIEGIATASIDSANAVSEVASTADNLAKDAENLKNMVDSFKTN